MDTSHQHFVLPGLRGLGVQARHLEIDLALPDSASLVMDVAQEWLGLPDVLVNNAAHSTGDGFERLDAATLDAHYAVNMRAAFLLAVEMAKRAKGLSRNNISTDECFGVYSTRWPIPPGLQHATKL